jgi:hypothetical protein
MEFIIIDDGVLGEIFSSVVGGDKDSGYAEAMRVVVAVVAVVAVVEMEGGVELVEVVAVATGDEDVTSLSLVSTERVSSFVSLLLLSPSSLLFS